MNVGGLFIVLVAVGIVALVFLPRVSLFGRAKTADMERRSGRDRRMKRFPVPFDRRRRNRRAHDAAKAFVEELSV